MAALPCRTPLVVGFLQMSQGDFGMFGRYLGLVRSAVLDRFPQMLDAGLRISIGLFFLSISGVLERGRGVFDERRSVSLIALIDSFLRVLDCLLEVTFSREKSAAPQTERGPGSTWRSYVYESWLAAPALDLMLHYQKPALAAGFWKHNCRRLEVVPSRLG